MATEKRKNKSGGSDTDDDDEQQAKKRGKKEEDDSGRSRVPLGEIRSGHVLSKTEFMRVLDVNPTQNKMRCEVLRGDKANDVWEITTHEALLACSTEYVQREVKLTKTQLAERLVRCKDDAFKVVFRPVLSQESLFNRLKEMQQELKEAKTDAALKKIAKKLLEVPEKTLRARLMEANTVLGYSLVDDLDQTDPQKVAFRNVAHNNILSLTVKGIRYVLK
jgi:hypothetical protein